MTGNSDKRLLIVSHLGREVGEELACHPLAPIVETILNPAEPWNLPSETDILITRIMPEWGLAPAVSPKPLTNLRWVQTRSAGIDVYPRWLLKDRVVATGRGLTAAYIAEYAMAAILRRVKRIEETAVRDGVWVQPTLGTLIDARIGVVGYGAIGQEFVSRARAFGANLRVLRKSVPPFGEPGVEFCSRFEDLLAWADHLILAVPLTSETRGLLSADAMMKARRGLHLVNVSRGELVDQEALIKALDAGMIGFATLDVMTPEPPPSDHPLLGHPKVTVTPHISWSGGDADQAFLQRMLRSLTLFAAGHPPESVVDIERGY